MAHIYLYEENIDYDIDSIIKMLVQSTNFIYDFPYACLFIIALKEKHGDAFLDIQKEIDEHYNDDSSELIENIIDVIHVYNLKSQVEYNSFYEECRHSDQLYDLQGNTFPFYKLLNSEEHNSNHFKKCKKKIHYFMKDFASRFHND